MCLQTVRPTLWIAPYKRGLAGKVALLEGSWMESKKRDKTEHRVVSSSKTLFFSRLIHSHVLHHSLCVCTNQYFSPQDQNRKKKNLIFPMIYQKVMLLGSFPRDRSTASLFLKDLQGRWRFCVAWSPAGRVETPYSSPFSSLPKRS